jgi:hypothetical protein
MRIALLVLFIAFSVSIVGALIYYGLKWSAHVKRVDPDNLLNTRFRPSGVVLMALFTAILVLFAAAFTLTPDSPLGLFLRTPKGVITAFLLAVVAFSIAGYALQRFGAKVVEGGHSD